jgi:hypothetical protein
MYFKTLEILSKKVYMIMPGTSQVICLKDNLLTLFGENHKMEKLSMKIKKSLMVINIVKAHLKIINFREYVNTYRIQ